MAELEVTTPAGLAKEIAYPGWRPRVSDPPVSRSATPQLHNPTPCRTAGTQPATRCSSGRSSGPRRYPVFPRASRERGRRRVTARAPPGWPALGLHHWLRSVGCFLSHGPFHSVERGWASGLQDLLQAAGAGCGWLRIWHLCQLGLRSQLEGDAEPPGQRGRELQL